MILGRALALVDLETTGENPVRDRITEVGLCLWHDDGSEWYWESLVNPYTAIPEFIRQITGISQAMVAEAPGFEELARSLYRYLEDCIFVAHNARFDNAFLRRAFEREGLRFRPKVLCTLRLSRRLYPEWPSHSLDNVCRAIGYRRDVSHRAMADVIAMKAFLEFAIADKGLAVVEEAAGAQWSLPALPVHIDQTTLDSIPDVPGVYRFYGENDGLLYVGKSTRMRSRVLSHFNSDHSSAKEMKLAQLVRAIEWEQTAGELGALLKENEQIKSLSPVYNHRQRRLKTIWYYKLDKESEFHWPVLCREELDGWRESEAVYGLYKSRKQAREALMALAAEHQLCQRRLGLEEGKGACFAYQLQRCTGACVGKESHSVFNARLQRALSPQRVEPWPYSEPIVAVEERDDHCDFHVIDYWAYLGSVGHEADVMPLLTKKKRKFDWDAYKLLVKFLPGATVLPLSSFGARHHGGGAREAL